MTNKEYFEKIYGENLKPEFYMHNGINPYDEVILSDKELIESKIEDENKNAKDNFKASYVDDYGNVIGLEVLDEGVLFSIFDDEIRTSVLLDVEDSIELAKTIINKANKIKGVI